MYYHVRLSVEGQRHDEIKGTLTRRLLRGNLLRIVQERRSRSTAKVFRSTRLSAYGSAPVMSRLTRSSRF